MTQTHAEHAAHATPQADSPVGPTAPVIQPPKIQAPVIGSEAPSHANHAAHDAASAHATHTHAAHGVDHATARPPVITETHPAHAAAEPMAPITMPPHTLPQPAPKPPIVTTEGQQHGAKREQPAMPHEGHAAKHEHGASDAAAMPVAHPTPAQTHVPHMTDAQLVILPDVLKQAEDRLAKVVIAPKISSPLRDKLMLDLTTTLGKDNTTDLILNLQGPMISPNPGLLGEEVLHALRANHLFADMFKGEHKPHVQKVDGKPDTVQVHVPHLTSMQYATLVQKLSLEKPVAQAPTNAEVADPVAMPAVAPFTLPMNQVSHAIPQGMVANDQHALGQSA